MYSILWNQCMIMLSCFNIFILFTILWSTSKTICTIDRKQPFALVWKRISLYEHYLVSSYVMACAIRVIWPRMDGDRHCFFNTFLSLISVGRTVATIAELSFMTQIGLSLIRMTGNSLIPTYLLVMNGLTQTCCWYAVLTQNQLGYIIEESIRMISVMMVIISLMDQVHVATRNRFFFQHMVCFLGIMYIIFLLFIDIPMYVTRYELDVLHKKKYMTITQGWYDIQRCAMISQSDSYWIHEMPWMTLYFSVTVWISLWMYKAKL